MGSAIDGRYVSINRPAPHSRGQGEAREVSGSSRCLQRGRLLRSETVTSANDTSDPRNLPTSLDLLYRDGWTVSGGIGHKFNDQWSGAVSLTWDRGTSHGYGTQTDTWTVGTGVSYMPTDNVELRLAGAIGILTSGSSSPQTYQGDVVGDDVTYDFGTDIVSAVSTSLKIKF